MRELGFGEDFLDFALGIYTYTLREPSMYKAVNDILNNQEERDNPGSPQVRAAVKFTKFIDVALERLPSYEAPEGAPYIYRGIRVQFEDGQVRFAPGTTFPWYSLRSASTDLTVMDKFCGSEGPRTLFEIDVAEGESSLKDISVFSEFPDEKELLARPLTMFEAICLMPRDPENHRGPPLETAHLVKLKEIPAPSDDSDKSVAEEVKKMESAGKMLQANPEDAKAWERRGDSGGGKVDFLVYSPADCYCESLRRDPENAGAWCKLGKLGGGRVAEEEPCSPKECFLKSLSLDRTNAEAWNALGDLGGGSGYEFGTYVEATQTKCYEKCLEHQTRRADAWRALGDLGGGRVKGKDCNQPECYAYVLGLEPANWEVWHALSRVGGGRVGGDDYTPVQCCEKSLDLNAENADAWLSLGLHRGGRVGGEDYDQEQCRERARKC